MDDTTDPDAAVAGLADEPEVRSGWSSLRWLPSLACGFVGLNIVLLGVVAAIKLVGLIRTQGWRPFEAGPSRPAMVLTEASAGILLFLVSGVAAILASASWMGGRWARALLLTLSAVVWFLVGAFLFGLARVAL